MADTFLKELKVFPIFYLAENQGFVPAPPEDKIDFDSAPFFSPESVPGFPKISGVPQPKDPIRRRSFLRQSGFWAQPPDQVFRLANREPPARTFLQAALCFSGLSRPKKPRAWPTETFPSAKEFLISGGSFKSRRALATVPGPSLLFGNVFLGEVKLLG